MKNMPKGATHIWTDYLNHRQNQAQSQCYIKAYANQNWSAQLTILTQEENCSISEPLEGLISGQ